MRKMMKGIAAVLAVSALMAGSAFAAEKFAVKATDGITTVFSVSETGALNANNAFYWDSANKRLGINTATPAFPFEAVSAGSVALRATRDNTDTANQLTGFAVANNDITPGNGISFSLTSKDSLGNLFAGAVFGAVFVSHTSGAAITDIVFKTTNQAITSTPVEQMRITGSGQIGLGVSAPKAKLHSTGSTIIGAATTANVDADLSNNQCNMWLNESTNAFTIKCKKSDGTVRVGTVTLN